MTRVAEPQLPARRGMRLTKAEQLQPRGGGYGDHRARLRIGHELARLAFKLQPLPQTAPFQSVGILDEHRQDARPLPGQAHRGDGRKAPAVGDLWLFNVFRVAAKADGTPTSPSPATKRSAMAT